MTARDRISELPGDIRKHILSFLTTRDAILTSTLSKAWRYEWLGLPCLDFGRGFLTKSWKSAAWDVHGPEITSRFLEFLEQAVIRHRPTTQKLRLCLLPIDDLGPKIASCLDGFIVDELHVEIDGVLGHWPRHSYRLPKCIVTTKSITKLFIDGCKLSDTAISEISLPLLRELSMTSVHVDQKVVDSLIASCDAIEKLCFCYCEGFRSLEVSRLPSLVYLKQKFNKGLEKVEINTAALETLCYSPHWDTPCELVSSSASCLNLARLELSGPRIPHTSALRHAELWSCSLRTLSISGGEFVGIDFRACRNLTELKLSSYELSSELLNELLSQLASLEMLEIAYCYGLELDVMKISLAHLRSITIRCRRGQETACGLRVEIDCPNLCEFNFGTKGSLVSLSLESKSLPTSVSLQFLLNATGDSSWDTNLIEMLKELKHSRFLTVETEFIENVIIPRRLRQRYPSPVCQFEHLRLYTRGPVSSLDVTRCIDALLWLCPKLETLCITNERLDPSPPCKSCRQCKRSLLKILLKLRHKDPIDSELKMCGCYATLPVNCWRHSLKDFHIIEQQGFEDDDGSLRRFLETAVM